MAAQHTFSNLAEQGMHFAWTYSRLPLSHSYMNMKNDKCIRSRARINISPILHEKFLTMAMADGFLLFGTIFQEQRKMYSCTEKPFNLTEFINLTGPQLILL